VNAQASTPRRAGSVAGSAVNRVMRSTLSTDWNVAIATWPAEPGTRYPRRYATEGGEKESSCGSARPARRFERRQSPREGAQRRATALDRAQSGARALAKTDALSRPARRRVTRCAVLLERRRTGVRRDRFHRLDRYEPAEDRGSPHPASVAATAIVLKATRRRDDGT